MASFDINSANFQNFLSFCNSIPPDIKEQFINSHFGFEESLEKQAIASPKGALQGVGEYFYKLNQAKIKITGTGIGHPGVDDHNPIGNRTFAGLLDVVEIRSSPVHDRGVFAKRDIKKGELVTFYPGDSVVFKIYEETNHDNMTHQAMISMMNFDMQFYTESFLNRYRFNVNEEYYIVGNPNHILDNAYIGHIINDGAILDDKNDTRKYTMETRVKCNVGAISLQGLHMAIVANRDIKKDEEIFMPYGAEYWRDRM